MRRLLFCLLTLLPLYADAEFLWRYSVGGPVAGNPVVHDRFVYVTGGNRLHVLNETGELTWSYDAGAPTFSSAAVHDEVVYLLAENGLHAIGKGGKKLWHFETVDGPLEVEGTTMGWGDGRFTDPWAWYRSAPSVSDGRVIFGNRQGTFAVDAGTGAQLWHARTGTTHTRPALHDDVVVVGSWDNHLYGLRRDDGAVTWKTESRLPTGQMAGWLGWEGFHLDPVIHEGIVYVGSRGTHFYAIDATSGVEKWSWKHPTSWVGSPAIVSDEVIYFAMSDGYCLVGLETRMGNQSLLFRNTFYNFARPQADDDHVYMASLSGELFAVDKSSGKGRRIFATENSKANLSELQSATGGLEFLHSTKGGYTHENASKDVARMLSKLDSLLSLTLDGKVLYAGSAGGMLYAISVQ